MVKKSRGGQTINSCSEEGLKPRKLKKKRLGTILIEVAFTLPIVIYLILFCIELIKINIVNDALQSICEEATYLTISHDWEDGPNWIEKIDAIIEKYRPSFIPKKAPGYYNTSLQPVIRLTVDPWSSLNDESDSHAMLKKKDGEPYGGSSIFYPHYELSANSADHIGTYIANGSSQFIPSAGQQCFPRGVINCREAVRYGEGLPDNTVFVLTVTCNYPFSSSIVKMLFGGGVNTKAASNTCQSYSCDKAPTPAKNCSKGNMYLLWARGAGIVNPK